MAIVSLPSALQIKTCAICDGTLTPDKATTGSLDGRGQPAFACISHFMDLEKLLLGWADFIANERLKYLQQGQEPIDAIYGGGPHARLNS